MTVADAALVAAGAHHLDAGSTVLRAWPLEGGVSARVTAIELIRSSGAGETVVLRQPNASRLEANPRATRQEYTLLSRLHRAGLPVLEMYRGLPSDPELLTLPFSWEESGGMAIRLASLYSPPTAKDANSNGSPQNNPGHW